MIYTQIGPYRFTVAGNTLIIAEGQSFLAADHILHVEILPLAVAEAFCQAITVYDHHMRPAPPPARFKGTGADGV